MALEQGRPIWVDKPTLGAYHRFSLSAFVPKLARFWAPSWTHGKHDQSAFGAAVEKFATAPKKSAEKAVDMGWLALVSLKGSPKNGQRR